MSPKTELEAHIYSVLHQVESRADSKRFTYASVRYNWLHSANALILTHDTLKDHPMSFFKKLFGGTSLNGDKLAASTEKPDYAQIELLGYFAVGRVLHPSAERSRWSRVLPQPYDETIKGFEKQGWLQVSDDQYKLTVNAAPFVQKYRERQSTEKRDVMPKVRKALQSKDTSEALEIRRAYEARQPLGQAEWSGVEPQLSHSALTRRILFLQHWLLDGLNQETTEWLKLYATFSPAQKGVVRDAVKARVARMETFREKMKERMQSRSQGNG